MDGLRFLMCVGIAIHHFVPYFFDKSDINTNKFGYFTDVFFILSAFFLTRSNFTKNWTSDFYANFLKMRFIRLYPLYFLSLCFYILIGIGMLLGLVNPDNPERYNFEELPFHLLLMQSWGFSESLIFNYVAWAISGLMLMYVLFPMLIVFAKKLPSFFTIAISLVLIGTEVFARETCGSTITAIQECNTGFLRVLPSFMFGIWLVYADQMKVGKRASVIGFALTVAALSVYPEYIEGPAGLTLVYAAVFFLFIGEMMGVKTPLAWKGFKTLARYSYALFILHPIIATIVIAFFLKRFFDFDAVFLNGPHAALWSLIAVLGCVTCSLLAAVVGHHLIEKPAIDHFKNYSAKKLPEAAA